jgi:hypothetical protein
LWASAHFLSHADAHDALFNSTAPRNEHNGYDERGTRTPPLTPTSTDMDSVAPTGGVGHERDAIPATTEDEHDVQAGKAGILISKAVQGETSSE